MKRSSSSGFTLIEMLTVLVIISILAALILNIHSYVNNKASRARAEGEIQAITAACEAYKADNGSYPRKATVTEGTVSGSPPTQQTVPLDPTKSGNPLTTAYKLSSQYLYGELSGDQNFNGLHEATEPAAYMNFRPDQLGHLSGQTVPVAFLQDPFGNSYGYSTAAATDEECYQQTLASNPAAVRPALHGFNSTFDLWSTGGRTNDPPTGGGTQGSSGDPNTVWNRWCKNW